MTDAVISLLRVDATDLDGIGNRLTVDLLDFQVICTFALMAKFQKAVGVYPPMMIGTSSAGRVAKLLGTGRLAYSWVNTTTST